MKQSTWALLTGDVVTNVIVCDDREPDLAHDYVAQESNDHDIAVCIDDVDPLPGLGWTRQPDGTFDAPPVPEPDPELLAAIKQLEADQQLVTKLLGKTRRTAVETQNLIDALARLAGVE